MCTIRAAPHAYLGRIHAQHCVAVTPTSPFASGLSKTLPGTQLIISVHRPMK